MTWKVKPTGDSSESKRLLRKQLVFIFAIINDISKSKEGIFIIKERGNALKILNLSRAQGKGNELKRIQNKSGDCASAKRVRRRYLDL